MSQIKSPLISIVTVSLNSQKTIQRTIDSVKNQIYKNIEYIIIDGGSEDKTVSIIKNNSTTVKKWVSENDNGIYDAFNKGLRVFSGDYIGFLNSDDYLLPDAMNILVNYINKNPNKDFFFGSVKKHWGVISGYYPRKIKYSWFFYTSHSTGFFIKRKAAKLNGKYSLKYQYSSDFDYFYRLIAHNKCNGIATKKNEIFGIFRPGGISATLNKEKHFFEKIQIRFDNKQNKFFLLLLIIAKFVKNLFSNNKIKLKKFIEFIYINYLK